MDESLRMLEKSLILFPFKFKVDKECLNFFDFEYQKQDLNSFLFSIYKDVREYVPYEEIPRNIPLLIQNISNPSVRLDRSIPQENLKYYSMKDRILDVLYGKFSLLRSTFLFVPGENHNELRNEVKVIIDEVFDEFRNDFHFYFLLRYFCDNHMIDNHFFENFILKSNPIYITPLINNIVKTTHIMFNIFNNQTDYYKQYFLDNYQYYLMKNPDLVVQLIIMSYEDEKFGIFRKIGTNSIRKRALTIVKYQNDFQYIEIILRNTVTGLYPFLDLRKFIDSMNNILCFCDDDECLLFLDYIIECIFIYDYPNFNLIIFVGEFLSRFEHKHDELTYIELLCKYYEKDNSTIDILCHLYEYLTIKNLIDYNLMVEIVHEFDYIQDLTLTQELKSVILSKLHPVNCTDNSLSVLKHYFGDFNFEKIDNLSQNDIGKLPLCYQCLYSSLYINKHNEIASKFNSELNVFFNVIINKIKITNKVIFFLSDTLHLLSYFLNENSENKKIYNLYFSKNSRRINKEEISKFFFKKSYLCSLYTLECFINHKCIDITDFVDLFEIFIHEMLSLQCIYYDDITLFIHDFIHSECCFHPEEIISNSFIKVIVKLNLEESSKFELIFNVLSFLLLKKITTLSTFFKLLHIHFIETTSNILINIFLRIWSIQDKENNFLNEFFTLDFLLQLFSYAIFTEDVKTKLITNFKVSLYSIIEPQLYIIFKQITNDDTSIHAFVTSFLPYELSEQNWKSSFFKILNINNVYLLSSYLINSKKQKGEIFRMLYDKFLSEKTNTDLIIFTLILVCKDQEMSKLFWESFFENPKEYISLALHIPYLLSDEASFKSFETCLVDLSNDINYPFMLLKWINVTKNNQEYTYESKMKHPKIEYNEEHKYLNTDISNYIRLGKYYNLIFDPNLSELI